MRPPPKTKAVLDALKDYYEHENANVHRGVHTLAERATHSYEAAREKVRSFINASETAEVLFTRGTTTSLNWVARSFGEQFIHEGDEILISYMEHHSNVIPWQQLAKNGRKLKIYRVDGRRLLDMEKAKELINSNTKIVSIAHVSNVLGVINPVEELAQMIHEQGGILVVDGAQSTPHMAIDVQQIDCDFFAFSGHKMCGPTGIGVLYGKRKMAGTNGTR